MRHLIIGLPLLLIACTTQVNQTGVMVQCFERSLILDSAEAPSRSCGYVIKYYDMEICQLDAKEMNAQQNDYYYRCEVSK